MTLWISIPEFCGRRQSTQSLGYGSFALMFIVDGSQMLRRDGTGVASYARSLAATLKSAGVPTALMLGQNLPVTRHIPDVGIGDQVFGNLPARSRSRMLFEVALRSRFGLSRRLDAHRVNTDRMLLASLNPRLPPHDAVFNVSDGLMFADAVFALRRRLTEVTVQEPVTIAHWAGPSPIRVRNTPNVYTFHDVIPLQMPHLVLDRAGQAARRYGAVAAAADHIITVSEQARQDIVDVLGVCPDRVSVTYQPVPHMPPIDREASERLVRDIYSAEPGEYAFFCGAMEPKKNLYRLIEAFTMAGTGLKLLIAGPLGWLYDDVVELLDQIGGKTIVPARRDVRWIGYLPRMHLAALMQCARFFAFPSIYEGFGLPVVEAMRLGVPVLTSGSGGLAEVAGDAALIVDPLNVPDMARKIHVLASDADLREELMLRGPVRAARFTLGTHLRLLAAAYQRVGVTIPVPVETHAQMEKIVA
jgi:glycosyltransferase involved in cell wall biosynthesis